MDRFRKWRNRIQERRPVWAVARRLQGRGWRHPRLRATDMHHILSRVGVRGDLAAMVQGRMLIIADDHEAIVLVNDTAAALLGYTPAEMIGRPLTALMPPRFRTAHQKGVRRYLATGQTTVLDRVVRAPALHRDGHEILICLAITDLSLEDATWFLATLTVEEQCHGYDVDLG